MGKRYVVPRKLTGMVPAIWRRRAEVPLGNVCTSVRGDSEGYWDRACATSLYVRLTSWYSLVRTLYSQLRTWRWTTIVDCTGPSAAVAKKPHSRMLWQSEVSHPGGLVPWTAASSSYSTSLGTWVEAPCSFGQAGSRAAWSLTLGRPPLGTSPLRPTATRYCARGYGVEFINDRGTCALCRRPTNGA